MNKKTGWTVFWVLISIFILLRLINDVLEMGERLGRLHPWLAWGFYALVLLLMVWALSVPIRWMFRAPVRDFGALFEEEIDAKALKEIRQTLLKGEKDEESAGILDAALERDQLVGILEEREKEVDDFIVQTGILTFLTTAISPNGFLDIIAVVYYNFRMIGVLVDRFGVRPSVMNILRILRNVFLTAFVVNQLEELELNEYIEEVMESFGDVATGKLLSKTLDSLMQGVLASFVTLKIGFAAKAVLVNPEQTKRFGFRKSIRRAARKSLIRDVLPKSAASVPKGFGRMILLLARRMRNGQAEMG